MSNYFFQLIAAKRNRISIDPTCHNAVFTDGKGDYTVKRFPLEDMTFDKMVSHLEKFNANEKERHPGIKCLMVSSPNMVLRAFKDDGALAPANEDDDDFLMGSSVNSMITYCAPGGNVIPEIMNIKSSVVSEDYFIPDRRQVAADLMQHETQMGGDADLMALADTAMHIELNGREAFQDA